MRNRLIAGLFATAVIILAAPVSAKEHIPSNRSIITADIEVIQGMIQRSQERQGSTQKTQEVESEPIAPIFSQIIEPEPVIEPISELTTTSISVSTITEQAQLSPVTVNQSAISTNRTKSGQPTIQTPAPDKSTFYNHSTQANTSSTNPVPSTFLAKQATSAEPQTKLQSEVVPQLSQQIAVRHIGIQRHQRETTDPEPSREDQISNRAFMLFTSDLAWERVDEISDKSIKNPYSFGARLESGVITPLAALRIYAPHRVAEALAILRGEKEYT